MSARIRNPQIGNNGIPQILGDFLPYWQYYLDFGEEKQSNKNGRNTLGGLFASNQANQAANAQSIADQTDLAADINTGVFRL